MTDISFTRCERQHELIADAYHWTARGARIALATLVNIEGSAPYPVGTQMLVDEDGQFLGQITGGCAEQAIADQAVQAIKNGVSCTQRYGLNSPYFDIQLPCGSGIDVFIDVDLTASGLEKIYRQLEARNVVRSALQTDLGEFTKRYLPTQRLLLVGQGPILISLAKLSLQTGFDVLTVAQNSATKDLAAEHGVDACDLQQTLNLAELCDEYTGLVSLFHEHELEVDWLARALSTDAFYIGALGSRRTHAARLQSLSERGIPETLVGRIRGPVGVNIQAQTPMQIAVSILAQAIDEFNRRHVS